MKSTLLSLPIALLITLPQTAISADCWEVSNIRGSAAYSDENYTFRKDGLRGELVICFTESGGTVTGTDIQFVKFGESTLAGYGGNDKGNETFEIYQIDRANKRLHYVKTRIGTKTIAPMLSDTVLAFVGTAQQLRK